MAAAAELTPRAFPTGVHCCHRDRHRRSDHDGPVFPNLAKNIVPTNLNQLWVADITYIAIATGFVYLAAILDAWSRRVVGYASLPHFEPPSRRADRYQGASITPIAVRSTLLR